MTGIIVIGPESTGTRMTTRILLNKGCIGDDSHEQFWDNNPLPKQMTTPIVWRKSVPHGVEWPNLKDMRESFLGTGKDDIRMIITTRDWHSQVSSMAKNHIQPFMEREAGNTFEKCYELALYRTQEAYLHIFEEINELDVPFMIVSYDLITLDVRYVNKMMEFLDLPLYTQEEYNMLNLKSANDKWYCNEG